MGLLDKRGKFELPPHQNEIDQRLLGIHAGEIKRLIITSPPRHGKSEKCSKYFPAWYLGHHPDEKIILSSYEHRFASSWGGMARDILTHWGPDLFGVKVRKGHNAAADDWGIEGHSGGMRCMGAGGAITGRGANGFILEDPIKNAEEANSQLIRDKIIEWYKSTVYTRLEPGGWVIVIMTRWHNEDLAGHLLGAMKEGGEKWELLNMPAIAESDDFPWRKEGDPLWRDRFPVPDLDRIKGVIGPYWWLALYQCRPTDAEGVVFKRSNFRYFTKNDKNIELHQPDGQIRRTRIESLRFFQIVDTAMKIKTENDWTVSTTFALTLDNDLLVWDVMRERLEIPDQWPAIKANMKRFPNRLFTAVEDKSSGTGIIQTAKRAGLPLRPLLAEQSKELRVSPDPLQRSVSISTLYENGAVYHLEGAHWLTDFEDELLAFPRGKHDDQVDTMGYAGIALDSIPMVQARPIITKDLTKDDLDDETIHRTRFPGMETKKPSW